MIQRIQSIYLSLITILSLLLFKGGFFKFSGKAGSVVTITFNGLMKGNGAGDLALAHPLAILSVLIVLLAVTSFLTVFLFKKRKIQLIFSKILIAEALLFLLASVYYAYSVIGEFDVNILPALKSLIPVLILIFAVLAYRGIKKDDELVRSYDRLR